MDNKFQEKLNQDQKHIPNVFNVVDSDEDIGQVSEKQVGLQNIEKFEIVPHVEVKLKEDLDIYKSKVILDIKTDEKGDEILDSLAKKIFDEIKIEGLKWNTDYKKVPIFYEIKKLQIECIIGEEIDIYDIIEQIQIYDDIVSGVDIYSFTKI